VDAVTQVPPPANEPVLSYAPGSPERATLEERLKELAAADPVELPATIGDQTRMAGGPTFEVTMPSDHAHVLGRSAIATTADATAAIEAAQQARQDWATMSFDDRAAIFLRAADLLAGPWRATLNAATMLGQGKTVQQAEIDAACELIDFWRFNVAFAREVLANQPISSPGVWNRTDYRPLDGFVYAITIVQLVLFAAFGLNQALQYRQVARWRSYLFGEAAYVVLSLAAKSLLAWLVYANVLRT